MPARSRGGQAADLVIAVPGRAQARMDIALEIGHEGVSSMDMRHRPTATAEENLALQPGVRISVSIPRPSGGGARDPSVLLNDTAHRLDGQALDRFDPRYTYDTYDGQNRTLNQSCDGIDSPHGCHPNFGSGPDWYALEFPEPVVVNCLEMTMGFAYRNGGWWTSLAVEARAADGVWQPVAHLQITPHYAFGDSRGERRPFETYALTFDAVATRALRVIGTPGGMDQFTSLARLAAYNRDLSRWNPIDLPPTPIPQLFRLIPPQLVWDLSESLSKLTGLTINLPLMEYYLDEERYRRRWHTMRRIYEGEPELWFLVAESIGWDAWNAIDSQSQNAEAMAEPYVRLTFHGFLAHAVAPIVAGGQILGELISHPVMVRDRVDWSWHRGFARQHGISWPAYRAAIKRSPHLSLEQLEGAAEIMGMIANTVAGLVYRLGPAHQGGERRSEQHRQQIVRQAIDLMQQHLEDPIGVAEIARALALSPHYFCDLFTEQTGHTPGDFLINLRIERAKEYLARTTMSPTDVCLVLGYSPSYFWRLFKRRTGDTPQQYKVRSHGHHGNVVRKSGLDREAPLFKAGSTSCRAQPRVSTRSGAPSGALKPTARPDS
ncbi:MAG TPA: AraC family transcriptional regulator [Chloroflexota bacterium]|nr:AraC family transcriptional regulator [Chloroflexota bacterium]